MGLGKNAEVQCPSTHITSEHLTSTRLTPDDIDPDSWAKVGSSGFLHGQATVFPFPCSVLRKRVTESSPSQGRGLLFHVLEGRHGTESENAWSQVETITVISRFGERYFEAVQIS